MTKLEFSPMFIMLCEAYNREATNGLVEFYYEGLKEISLDEFKKAISIIAKTRKDPSIPKPAEILEALIGSSDEKALLAWDDVLFAMNEAGSYNSVAFKDKAIMKAIELLGGWIWLNDLSRNELKWAKKEFLSTYKAFAGKPVGITHLKGICETKNRFKDGDIKLAVILIGYSQKGCSLESFLAYQNKIKKLKNLKTKALR